MRIPSLLPALALLFPGAALAQQVPDGASEPSVFNGDFIVVGAAVAAIPSYEGSDDRIALPVAGVAGRLGGIGISARAAGVALDFISERAGSRQGFTLGPVLRYRMNRSGRVADPVVEKLGKLKGVIEGGVVLGADRKGVFNPHDSLAFGVDVRWDLSSRHSSMIVAPGVSYLTPLSRGDVAGLAATASWVDTGYARDNYGVTPAGSLASGLPVYAAKGGFKDLTLGGFLAHDLNNNLTDGGLAIAAGAMYSRLFGSAAETPITRLRGKASQWFFAGGVAYVF